MSLLLDALKKAAEQKAEKSKAEGLGAKSSDETLIDTPKEDVSELENADDSHRHDQRERGDETELDHSELKTRFEKTRVEHRDDDETYLDDSTQADVSEHQVAKDSRSDGQETQLDPPEDTITLSPSLSDQMETGEDETIIFAHDDVSEFLGEPELVKRDREDKTDLNQLGEDETETDTRPVQRVSRSDETDLSQITSATDETQISRLKPPPPEEDTDFIGGANLEDEDDSVKLGQEGRDDDMSLLLVEQEETDISAPTSATDPRSLDSDTQVRIIEEDGTITGGMGLVDLQEETAAEETKTESTSTTDAAATAFAAEGTMTRADSTSTRTYAPDNYDRTLMKLPNEDASRLFAGMKSESDVVMTPDYAKKVFQSKSSAQRLQHYKVYVGIAVVILLTLGFYGALEYQEESFNIDTSLRPLKYDPMPGVIRSTEQDNSASLFAQNGGSGVDTRTIELIENAETLDQGVIAEAEPEQAAEPVVEISEPVEQPKQQSVQTAGIQKTLSGSAGTENQAAEPKTSSLQITSSKRVGEKDRLLREAYAAYQVGNDRLALSKYNQVLELDPGNRNALLARAAINVQNNNARAAIEDYQALLLVNPKDTLAMTSMIAVANYSPGETESQLKLMIRQDPNSPYLNFALANVYGAQNRWQEAQGLYFRALEQNPDDPNYAYNLAVSLEHIEKPGVAIGYYQRALDNFSKGLATFSKDVVDQRLETLRKL